MKDKKDNTGTGLDISIEDILEDPTLGANDENVSPEESVEDEKPLIVDSEHFIKEPFMEAREEEPEKIEEIKEIKEPTLPEKTYVPEEVLESKEIIPPTMDAVEVRDVPIVNDPDELLQGATDPDSMVKQLMEDPTKNDTLYTVLKQEENTGVLLGNVMQEIAEELAYLKAYRRIHYIANEDISEVSLKRTKALESLVKALVEKDKLKRGFDGKIDFYGEKFEKVMEFILTVVKEAFEKIGIPEQFNDIFFVQLAQDLEGFEKKVEKVYYGTPQTKSKK
jgi:hypothetical protein